MGETTADELFAAIKAGDAGRVGTIIGLDADSASARDATGLSAVLTATYYGQSAIRDQLVAAGASLDTFEAAALGRIDRLESLLSEDAARANTYSVDGWTPLALAAFFGHAESVELLLSRGADVTAVGRNNLANTPLHAATAGMHGDVYQKRTVVELLLSNQAPVDARDGSGWTPLAIAAHNGDRDLVELFLRRGADVSARANNGKTPLALALEQDRGAVVALLREHGAVE